MLEVSVDFSSAVRPLSLLSVCCRRIRREPVSHPSISNMQTAPGAGTVGQRTTSQQEEMTVLSIWKASPDLLDAKTVKQIIGIAGSGRLTDDGDTSREFRALLSEIPSGHLERYCNQCLSEAFQDSGLVLQDVINEMGRRLGFSVTNGRYRGKTGSIGNDGLWELPNHHKIILEVKTTDAYRIDLDVIADYRRALIREGHATEGLSSVLIVVGRADTGDLEAQIRGSRNAWEMRLISVDALIRLMKLKESVEDPDALRRVYEILIPREFTKLDEIVELVFSTAEDAKITQDTPEPETDQEPEPSGQPGSLRPKFTPVAFNELVAKRASEQLALPLLKRTRTLFSSPDDSTRVLCVVSKEYKESAHRNYWFAFHPHQKERLEQAARGYAAFGCGSPERVVLVPIANLASWTDGMNVTEKETTMYWHIQIFEEQGQLVLVRKRGQPRINLAEFTLACPPENPAK